MDRLLRAGEVAELLGVSESTVHNWRYKRTGPPAIKVGGAVRWPESAIEAWIKQQNPDVGEGDTAGKA
jgi:excisionase family DNA binding protein